MEVRLRRCKQPPRFPSKEQLSNEALAYITFAVAILSAGTPDSANFSMKPSMGRFMSRCTLQRHRWRRSALTVVDLALQFTVERKPIGDHNHTAQVP